MGKCGWPFLILKCFGFTSGAKPESRMVQVRTHGRFLWRKVLVYLHSMIRIRRQRCGFRRGFQTRSSALSQRGNAFGCFRTRRRHRHHRRKIRFRPHFDSGNALADTPDSDNPPFVTIPLKHKIIRDWNILKWRFRGMRRFANRIYPTYPRHLTTPEANAIYNIRLQIGDRTILSANEARRTKRRLERNLRCKINFDLSEGDIVLSCFDQLPQTICSQSGNPSLSMKVSAPRVSVTRPALAFKDSRIDPVADLPSNLFLLDLEPLQLQVDRPPWTKLPSSGELPSPSPRSYLPTCS
ncbi:uncharacterized protein LOC131878617 isoform X2 [Tigriopus californicus]|uniref:uncharacterized protein LOC131878617 isoform X2 n=1 Tax=Tigriopus californicus TaxID=6832 RepID=UPI0027DA25B9|nr:uncharacterized protein LOC131878617 isoform X2 [Tigriopus californicus]